MPDSHAGASARLSYSRPPASAAAFVGALVDRRPGRLPAGVTSPRIEGRIENLRWSEAFLKRYRGVCGFVGGSGLPLPFPHVVGAGLHLRMLLHKSFPVRLPGLVHVWHRIRHQGPIEAGGRLSMYSWIDGHEDTATGAEFCLQTQLLCDDQVVWEEQTGFVARAAQRRAAGGRSRAAEGEPEVEMAQVARIEAPANVGRRYARASGDYNPIHLSAASARPFGFPKAIAHGMWTLARCVAELGANRADTGAELMVRFRRPVFLPASLVLEASEPSAEGRMFRLIDADNSVTCLSGRYGAAMTPADDATG